MTVIPWRRLQGAFGAEITGVDVRDLDPAALVDLVHSQQLLVIRDQVLTPAELAGLGASLGDLDEYPFAEPLPGNPHVVAVIKNPGDMVNFGGAWHTDTSYLPRPPGLTLLYAVEVPRDGGDTLFADMCAAFDALSPKMQALLQGMQGCNTAALVHDTGGAHAAVAGPGASRKAPEVEGATEAVHPVVRVHPVTGRRALYVSRIHTERFDGMTREESAPLIDFLQQHAVRAERLTRLRWRQGSLALWDNRTLQHHPLNDYHGLRREMHRVILRGEPPRGVEDPNPA